MTKAIPSATKVRGLFDNEDVLETGFRKATSDLQTTKATAENADLDLLCDGFDLGSIRVSVGIVQVIGVLGISCNLLVLAQAGGPKVVSLFSFGFVFRCELHWIRIRGSGRVFNDILDMGRRVGTFWRKGILDSCHRGGHCERVVRCGAVFGQRRCLDV